MSQPPVDLIIAIVIPLAIVLMSLSVHEAAHAWSADRLGDPTARMLGRISLNPIVHIDLIGTIVLPLISALTNLPLLGWAKPVPVNTSRLKHPRRDFALIAAAGPASNILLAAIGGVILLALSPREGLDAYDIVRRAATINIFLAVFNLVPVPPLDGGNVLAGLLPGPAAAVFDTIRPFGIVIIYALIFTGLLSEILFPAADFLARILIP
jgi:Zn-dependent protease